MKKLTIFCFSLLAIQITFSQSVGVGTNNPDESAVLDVSSTTQGILVPRMNSAQRGLINNPATGLLVFDINTNSFWFKGGTSWVELIDSSNKVVHNNGSNIYMGMNGNVGIGTDAPNSKLEVKADQQEELLKLKNQQTEMSMKMKPEEALIESLHALTLKVGSGIAHHLSVMGNGSVGIGTKVPKKKLHVEGETLVKEALTIGNEMNEEIAKLKIKTDAPATGILQSDGNVKVKVGTMADAGIIATASNHPLRLSANNGADHLTISPQGMVGIGVPQPLAPLHFKNETANRKIVLWSNGNNEHQYFGFGINPSMLRYQAQGDHAFFNGIDNMTSNELMRIKSNGYVGIGTEDPVQKLHVAGGATISGDVGIGVTSPGATLEVERGTAPFGTMQVNGTTHDSHFNYGTPEDTYIRGGKAGAKVIINELGDLGNVGIGVSTPGAKLVVSRGTSVNAPNGALQIDGTTYASHFSFGANDDTYIRGGKAGSKVIINDYGDFGNVGIGTSDPLQKLHVAGKVVIDTNLGIGYSSPGAPLQFNDVDASKKIVLSKMAAATDGPNDFRFNGFGMLLGNLRYQVGSTEYDHVFYSAFDENSNIELMRVKGNGNVDINGTLEIGYQVATQPHTVAPTSTEITGCNCPPGLKALGGGWIDTNGFVVTGSYPAADGSAWVIRVTNPYPASLNFTIYAVCARFGN